MTESTTKNTKKNNKEEVESEESEEGENEEGDEPEEAPSGKKGKKQKKKKKRKKAAAGYSADVDDASSAAHSKINLETLSKKDELFQVRFIVHKARKLNGAIQAPLVRIHLDTKVLRTKAKKGKNPRWNETVLFSITKSELDLISTSVEIRVIDSLMKHPHNLIGLYKCDLSVAWVSKDKNLFFKWFVLTNPDEPQDGMTGYVNISIQIIPPGESAKDLPRLRDEEIDVSNNVFYPPGLTLQPGQFLVKIFNGEDIPQMDSSVWSAAKDLIQGNFNAEESKSKELVDPYVKIEFAGKAVESSTQYTTFDPIWNEVIVVPGEFPSMAETIVLKVYDNDDYAIDDLIATKLMLMERISYPSSDSDLGFSPTFGPAYIPLYGSVREFNEIYDQFGDLNYGVGEGIAYRGRILVEIATRMGPPPDNEPAVSPIPSPETDSVMAGLRRHKYHLFASFYQGNMIYEKENQVEFEISIGEYGNKMSPEGSLAPSTTQPCNAVYDGNAYHFMPWGRSKPTVILHSQWEDIQYRVEALNTLLWIDDFIQMKMDQYFVMEKAFALESELLIKFDNVVSEALAGLKTLPLEPPDSSVATELDKKLYRIRQFTLENLINEIEMLLTTKYQDLPRTEKMKKLAASKEKLEGICYEPQIGIPDVFLWMLTGNKRVAYTRIPINEIMYSKSKFGRGKHCGTTGSFFLKIPNTEDDVGAHLTLSLWFGKFEHVTDTFKPPRGSEVAVYAETYENQMSVLGSWSTRLLSRPQFSDGSGKYSLPLQSFEPPDGWEFHGDWFISIDRSLIYDNETGLKEYTEEVYEGQTRLPGAQWTGTFVKGWWQDNKGDESPPKDDLDCREGWQWLGEWEVDKNRAVDALGWEYTLNTDVANYSPIERGYHLSRRRRWQRRRERLPGNEKNRMKDIDPDGWEYSKLFTTKFHPKERKFDMVRRRRHNRKLVSSVPMPVVFKIQKEEAKKDKPPEIFNMAPRIITEYNEKQVHKYQLRAYLYQARGLLGADPSGYSDPYAKVVFGNRSATTHVVEESCSPVWDVTLVLDAVEVCGFPEDVASNPPYLIIELFDEDVLDHDRLGRVVCKPNVFNSGSYKCTKLRWYPIGGTKRSKGDLLAAFEMFKLGGIELPPLPPYDKMKHPVPADIRPQLQLTRVEVLTWGVRSMKDYKMLPVESPSLDIEVGGKTLRVEKIDSVKRHPNFNIPHDYIDVYLPIKEEFLPPINIRILDNRAFGYSPLVAVATIKEYGQYRTEYALHDYQKSDGKSLDNDSLAIIGEISALDSKSEVVNGSAAIGTGEHGIANNTGDLLPPPSNAGTAPSLRQDEVTQQSEVQEFSTEEVTTDGPRATTDSGDYVLDLEGHVWSGSKSLLIEPNTVIENPMSKSASADSVRDITIAIPDSAIEASKTGVPAKKDKQLEKDLKMQEKIAKKEAKMIKKQQKKAERDQRKNMKMLEKQRDREAKQQAKARYKAEQEAKKKALKDIDNDNESDEERIPDDPEPTIKFTESPTTEKPPEKVPDKAAGLLGMWYGASTVADDTQATTDSTRRLSRRETRRLKKMDEEPHPDDILVSDWWSKYYHCIGTDPRLTRIFEERNLPTIKLYDADLETEFNNFRDLMDVINLKRPDNEISFISDDSESDDEINNVGLFKGAFKIYPITSTVLDAEEEGKPKLMFSNLPNNKPSDVTIRLYVVAGMNLTPLDFGGSVDPYLWVKCGKTVIDDKSNYQTKKINPIFGKMFEIKKASLPRDSKLIIKVYDHDLIGANDLIGTTTIDLEDRFLSWRRASCGISQQYIIEKESKDRWRDTLKPLALLKRMCLLKGWAPPTFKGKGSTLRCYVDGVEHKMKHYESGRGPMTLDGKSIVKKMGSEEHRLALYVLQDLGLVPEHLETRTLYNDDCPGIPQGKIHLWVDIFPYDRNLPPPVNITPRVAQKMVLRIIIWNTQDVKLDDTSITGEKMSDIFIKCHLEGSKKDAQETDVHYRSLTGEGNFNWRMVYNFEYIMPEQKMVLWKKQSFFSIEKSEEKVDPLLHVRVFDYDIFSSDDLLGSTELNLVSLPPPTKTHKECHLDIYDTPLADRISIFDKKKIKGFWPVFELDPDGERELTGKVEMELEVLTEEEANERPAGKAREEPNLNPTLEPPNRPETSFNWFFNPFMVFKVLIWGRFKWYIIGGLIILLFAAFLVLLIYTSPQAINNAIMG